MVEVEMQNNLEGTAQEVIEALEDTIKRIREGDEGVMDYNCGEVLIIQFQDEDDEEE